MSWFSLYSDKTEQKNPAKFELWLQDFYSLHMKKKSNVDVALVVVLNPPRGVYVGATNLTYLYLKVMRTEVHYSYPESKGHDLHY